MAVFSISLNLRELNTLDSCLGYYLEQYASFARSLKNADLREAESVRQDLADFRCRISCLVSDNHLDDLLSSQTIDLPLKLHELYVCVHMLRGYSAYVSSLSYCIGNHQGWFILYRSRVDELFGKFTELLPRS